MKYWLVLAAAILLEVTGSLAMKYSEGLTRLVPALVTGVCYLGAVGLLTVALRGIELGIAYAVWAGLGTALVAVLGIVLFGESASLLKFASIALVIAGVVGLNLAAK